MGESHPSPPALDEATPHGADSEPSHPQHYRALFLSDLHLYSAGCRYRAINRFLKQKHFQYIYLLGDIVDLWRLNPRRLVEVEPPVTEEDEESDGSEKSINIIRRLLKRCQFDGTRIVYLPGNHDAFFRNFDSLEIFGVRIQDTIVHRAADGRRYLLFHGDRFDTVVHYHRWLAFFSAAAYDWGIWLNRGIDHLRRLCGREPWSLATYLKTHVDERLNYRIRFEEEVIAAGRAQRVDGVICGHNHIPVLREEHGFVYANCGDWIEHTTALIEHMDGRLELVHEEESRLALAAKKDENPYRLF